MEIQNNVTEFVLLGLFKKPEIKLICFAIFLICYFAIFFGNIIIFITIICSHLIQQPMYYFLCHLSYMDLAYTSTVVPRLLRDLIVKQTSISYNSCMTQLFAAHFLSGVEMFILVSMAFDRYVAICKPLHYMIVVNRQRCNMMLLMAWLVAFWHAIAQMFMVIRLPFCGPNQVDHYVCDVKALLKLVCTDTHIPNILVIANTGMVVLATFLVLVASYIIILYNLRNHSSDARWKALSTCASHVMVVVLFFVPCIATYIPPPSASQNDKEFSMFYTVIAPMMNPLIYTLRNTEMKNAMQKVWAMKIFLIFK
ncbi:olfactory receptor 4P4-like [Vombatus ursinus]|uniref:olfactory receptor 4P4-like n=1 Tax=Vombatus ursinus TaxID=29139 RepID=UPI000FFD3B41|nr:olfactory receptor 4P4-like [Vombatus ursinus]